ncbi:MAG: hypothetical protein M5U05_19600 [Anaerolineales bacterium]|nr:hypothetical protein [Anaerolineales bacterium]
MSAKKRKPAGEVTIKMGNLFKGLPDDHHKAAQIMANGIAASETMDCNTARANLRALYTAMWSELLRDVVHNPGPGPKGPRLPAGIGWINLVPHLAEARRVLAAKEISFEAWCESHQWPGGMKVKGTTARNWLKRYAKQIAAYEPSRNK